VALATFPFPPCTAPSPAAHPPVLVHPRSPLPTPPLFQTETAPSKVQIRKKGGWISSSAAGAHRSIDRSIDPLPPRRRPQTNRLRLRTQSPPPSFPNRAGGARRGAGLAVDGPRFNSFQSLAGGADTTVRRGIRGFSWVSGCASPRPAAAIVSWPGDPCRGGGSAASAPTRGPPGRRRGGAPRRSPRLAPWWSSMRRTTATTPTRTFS